MNTDDMSDTVIKGETATIEVSKINDSTLVEDTSSSLTIEEAPTSEQAYTQESTSTMDTMSSTVDGSSRYYIPPADPLRRMQDSRFIQGDTATLESGSGTTNAYTTETTSDSTG